MNIRKKGLLVGAFLLCMNLGALAQSLQMQLKGVTVEKAMTELRQKSGYSFVFESADVNTAKVVSVNAKDVKQAVEQILRGQSVSYEIKGKNIVVSKKQGKTVATAKANNPKKKVTGTITDENGEPIIGATIKEKGTQNAVISDVDGNFVLNTTEGAELEITYIGYADQTLKVTGKDNYSVSMSSGTKELNEVVVTALGIKRAEKALSYNVQQVSGEDLLTNKDANFINSLNGKVAGVNINARL